jgi:hypothetical protein
MSQKKEIAEMVRILIDSTCTYSASNIYNERNRFAYVRAMSRCLNLCMSKPNKNDIGKMRVELLKLRREVPKTFTWRWEPFSDTKRYYMLGIYQSLEVVESIHVRFEKGYSWADEYFVRSILGVKRYEV